MRSENKNPKICLIFFPNKVSVILLKTTNFYQDCKLSCILMNSLRENGVLWCFSLKKYKVLNTMLKISMDVININIWPWSVTTTRNPPYFIYKTVVSEWLQLSCNVHNMQSICQKFIFSRLHISLHLSIQENCVKSQSATHVLIA